MVIDNKSAKKLEDSFFIQQDQQLIAKLRQMKQMQKSKEALRSVSGIKNDHILDKLVQMNVRAEMVAALAVVPLVEVAWADGHVDEKERAALLEKLDKAGIKRGSVEFELLESWLGRRPGRDLLDSWSHYVHGLWEEMDTREKNELKDALLHDVRAIAEASGGFLGLGKVSAAEKEMILKLESVFER